MRGQCPAESVSYEVLGGEIDDVVQVVSGSQVPRVGQAMVLLLSLGSSGPRLASWTFGQLPIVTGQDGLMSVRLPGRSIAISELRHLAVTAITQ